MRRPRLTATGAIGIAFAFVIAGCSSTTASTQAADAGGSSNSPSTSAESAGSTESDTPADGAGKTLTVWAMTGDLSTDTLNAINAQFEKETGAKVDVQTQQWEDINTKITTALATDTPPDVIDMGGGGVATYAASGGLVDLTADKTDLKQGQTWLGGLEEPATIDGKLYGVPSFAAARAVIYNKTMWSEAGVTAAPTTYAELQADLDKVKGANTAADFSAFYLPGQYWYAGIQWLWDAGAEIAAQDGGTWTAGFADENAIKALTAWKEFQNTYSSKASQTLNTRKPDQDQLLADGTTATILGNTADFANILKDNPKLTAADLGTFAMPGLSGKNQPALLAGSDWGIATKSTNQDLAKAWVKIAASPDIQSQWVFGHDAWIPNSVEASEAAIQSGKVPAGQEGLFTAAQISKATPASGNWAQLEEPGMEQFFQTVASGSKTVQQAAQDWDATVNTTLNGG
jgi:N,N'-diacetylchitobiose transport system substrate-binding protein